MRLRDIGEAALLAKILPKLPRNGRIIAAAGDDCAVVKFARAENWLVLKSDCVVEHVHFARSAPPRAVGWKAMMRTLSDFAAMSAVPQFALITLAIEGRRKVQWVSECYRGLSRAAARLGVAIVGGETSSTQGPTVIAVSAVGDVEHKRCVWRSGGKPGDDLFVTGRLGGSFPDRHLNFMPRLAESRWLTSHFKVHAMIDLSDGLGSDLPRLAHASKTGFTIDEDDIPLGRGCSVKQAISDGEDYELLFALSRRNRAVLTRSWLRKFPRVPLTRIGELTSRIRNQRFPPGYVHFSQRR